MTDVSRLYKMRFLLPEFPVGIRNSCTKNKLMKCTLIIQIGWKWKFSSLKLINIKRHWRRLAQFILFINVQFSFVENNNRLNKVGMHSTYLCILSNYLWTSNEVSLNYVTMYALAFEMYSVKYCESFLLKKKWCFVLLML